MKLAYQLCSPFVYSKSFGSRIATNFSDDYLNDDIWNTINDYAPAFNETFMFCKLFNKWIDCGKLFVPQITQRGLCYTFNTLNFHELFTNA